MRNEGDGAIGINGDKDQRVRHQAMGHFLAPCWPFRESICPAGKGPDGESRAATKERPAGDMLHNHIAGERGRCRPDFIKKMFHGSGPRAGEPHCGDNALITATAADIA